MASEEEEEEDQNKSHIQLSVQNRHRSHIVVVLLGDFFFVHILFAFCASGTLWLETAKIAACTRKFLFCSKEK